MTLFNRSGGIGGPIPKLHSLPPNPISGLPDKVIFEFTVYYEVPPNKLKITPNAVDLAMELYLPRPANTGENQLITK